LGVVEKLLSLITFFAAAKKVIPPPGNALNLTPKTLVNDA
jgi:hypothetical protein